MLSHVRLRRGLPQTVPLHDSQIEDSMFALTTHFKKVSLHLIIARHCNYSEAISVCKPMSVLCSGAG